MSDPRKLKTPKFLRKSPKEQLREIFEGPKLNIPKEQRPPPTYKRPEPPEQNIGQGKPLPKRELDPFGELGKAEQRYHNQQVSSGVDILKGERGIDNAADQFNADLARQVLGWPAPTEEPPVPGQKDPGPAKPAEEPREQGFNPVWPQTQYEQAWNPGGKVDPNAPEFVTPFMESTWKPQDPPPANEAGIDNGLGPNNPFNPKPWDPMP